jgi:hypothetical protein
MSRIWRAVPLTLALLVFAGCSEEEASKETEKTLETAEQKTTEGAQKVKETAGEAADKVKEKTPILIQNMKDSYKESEQEVKDNTLQPGDPARVKKDAYLALTPEAYEELYQLIEINDEQGIADIEKSQQVSEIGQDSEAEIIERDIRRAKVKINETGEEGFLPTSMLEPMN